MNGRKVIRERREAAGMTQRELGIRSGLTERTIRELELGRQDNPNLSTLEALAQAFGITADELLKELLAEPQDKEVAKTA